MAFAPGHDTTRGARNPHAVFTDEDIVRLREAVAAGTPQRTIARTYGMSESLVSRVVLGKAWAHVGGPIKRTYTVFEYPEATPAS